MGKDEIEKNERERAHHEMMSLEWIFQIMRGAPGGRWMAGVDSSYLCVGLWFTRIVSRVK